MTIDQIAEEHEVSRSALHTYRRSGTFPQPVPVEGTTRVLFDAGEVAAWFEANPKQQGKKRGQFISHQQGEPVTTTVDPRLALMSRLHTPPYDGAAGTYSTPLGEAARLLDAYKAAVLREAADKLDESETLRDLTDDHMSDVNAAANELRRMADEESEPADG